MATISNKLTDLYTLFDKYQRDLEPIYEDGFKTYLNNQETPEDFVKAVFTYGFEIRDLPINTFEDDVVYLIDLIQTAYKNNYQQDVESDDKLLSIYNIGLINCYLYFCQRNSEAPDSSLGTETLEKLNPAYFSIDRKLTTQNSATLNININRSVNYLRLATILADSTMEISKGIYHYHTIRIFEYIFSIFENYSVDNDNKPIDLDSFYVFSDQLDSEILWLELAKQIKLKQSPT